MKDRIKLVVCAFFVLLPWIFFDIDLGDAAYHSLSSWLMAFHPKMPPGELPLWFEQVPVWFSYFVDSLWWKVIGPDASILATRFGWLIFQILVLLGLYESFRRLFPGRDVVWPLLLGLLAVNCGADDFVLSYYVVPPAFGALAFAWLAVAVKENSLWFGIFSGFFAMLSIQARLPAALPILAAVMVALAVDFFLSRSRNKTLRIAGAIALGLFLGGVVSVLALVISGQAEYFIPGIKSFWLGVSGASNQRYSKGLVLQRAMGHYFRIFAGVVMFVPAFLLFDKWGDRRWAKPLLVIILFAIAVLALAKYGTVLAIVIGGSIFLIVYGIHWRKPESWQLAVFLGALACLAGFTLGTFLEGLQTFKYGLWLLVPAALLISTAKQVARCWLPSIIGVLFFVTRVMWPTFPFLERPIFQMKYAFELSRANGLFTYEDKSKSLQELVEELQALGVKSGDELFVYAGVPTYYPIAGVYLLTNTVPYLHDPAIVEYPGARWPKHKKTIEAGIRAGSFPRVVVRQTQLMSRASPSPRAMLKDVWTLKPEQHYSDFKWTRGVDNGLAGDMDEILRTERYQPIWHNAYFVVLARP